MTEALVASSWQETRDRLNLFYTFEAYARSSSTAKKTFLACEGKTWTYREAYDIVLRYGCWLQERHAVKPKEIVAMDLINSPQFIFLWLGLWSIGACPAFINYNLSGDSLMHCIKTSTARLILVDEALKETFPPTIVEWAAGAGPKGALKPVEIVFLSPQIEYEISAVKGTRPPNDLRNGIVGHDTAVLIYTSGTTGMPKPAIVSWGKVAVGSKFVGRWYGLKRTDSFYTVSSSLHLSSRLSPLSYLRSACHYIIRPRLYLASAVSWSGGQPSLSAVSSAIVPSGAMSERTTLR